MPWAADWPALFQLSTRLHKVRSMGRLDAMTEQLDLRKTYRAILDAARERRFISYGGLARANDANWRSV